jgi:ankyrin repeat protein
MLAACGGDLCELLDLILSDASIDQRDTKGWTALHYACAVNEYEIAVQLLDSGADPNGADPDPYPYSLIDTPLTVAAAEGNFDLVRLLIAHGADPDLYAGYEALRAEYYARSRGFHHISEFLLYHEGKKTRKSP